MHHPASDAQLNRELVYFARLHHRLQASLSASLRQWLIQADWYICAGPDGKPQLTIEAASPEIWVLLACRGPSLVLALRQVTGRPCTLHLSSRLWEGVRCGLRFCSETEQELLPEQ